MEVCFCYGKKGVCEIPEEVFWPCGKCEFFDGSGCDHLENKDEYCSYGERKDDETN